jgi:hypothetical protein
MPGFSINGSKGPDPNVEPYRAHRWSFIFAQVHDLADVELYAMTCQRPSVDFDTITLHNQQTRINMPGKHKWNPINVKFYEVQQFEVASARKLFDYWANGSNGPLNYKTNTLNKDFRTTATVVLESGIGVGTHGYELYNTWPSKVAPSELNYSSSDLTTIQVTLTYDSAREDLDAANLATASGASNQQRGVAAPSSAAFA